MDLELMDFWVGARHIGKGGPCLIIAEVGLAHDGSLALAHAYIDGVAQAGADACKFQCHTGDPTTEWRVKPDWPTDVTRQDYWRRTAFFPWQWQELARHCADVGVEFLCSVFSLEALRIIDPLVRLHKVPSGRVTDLALLDAIAATGKPLLLSTGMATDLELAAALKRFPADRVGLMQCVSLYPCPAEAVGLLNVAIWGGLSDHSGTIYPGIAAAALGCQVLEVHVKMGEFGLDAVASLTFQQLGQLVEGVRFVERAMRPAVRPDMTRTRQVFMGVGA